MVVSLQKPHEIEVFVRGKGIFAICTCVEQLSHSLNNRLRVSIFEQSLIPFPWWELGKLEHGQD